MLVRVPDHFSSKFKLNLSKLQATFTDRASVWKSIAGIVLGFLMFCLGILELFTFVKVSKIENNALIMVEFFAFIMVIVALGIILNSVASFIRYKKIYFDGNTFHITYRPALGIKYNFNEPIEEYEGVRLRVLYKQAGPFNVNRYIIDLYHNDSRKIIPLYISSKNKNIRNIWENYAKFFKLPALSVGERGVVKREYEDLDKSIMELAKKDKLPFIASGKYPNPQSIFVEETRNSIFIKQDGHITDYLIPLFKTIMIACVLIYGIIAFDKNSYIPLLVFFIVSIGFLSMLWISFLIAKPSNSITITNESISVQKRAFNFTNYSDKIELNLIKNIELSYNPAIDQYSLIFISNQKIISFDGRLQVNDLIWIKDFIIRKLIGN